MNRDERYLTWLWRVETEAERKRAERRVKDFLVGAMWLLVCIMLALSLL